MVPAGEKVVRFIPPLIVSFRSVSSIFMLRVNLDCPMPVNRLVARKGA